MDRQLLHDAVYGRAELLLMRVVPGFDQFLVQSHGAGFRCRQFAADVFSKLRFDGLTVSARFSQGGLLLDEALAGAGQFLGNFDALFLGLAVFQARGMALVEENFVGLGPLGNDGQGLFQTRQVGFGRHDRRLALLDDAPRGLKAGMVLFELVGQQPLLQGQKVRFGACGRFEPLFAGEYRLQAGDLHLHHLALFGQPFLVGATDGGVEFEQQFALVHLLAVADVDGLDYAAFEGLNQLGVVAGDDLAPSDGDDVDFAQRRP